MTSILKLKPYSLLDNVNNKGPVLCYYVGFDPDTWVWYAKQHGTRNISIVLHITTNLRGSRECGQGGQTTSTIDESRQPGFSDMVAGAGGNRPGRRPFTGGETKARSLGTLLPTPKKNYVHLINVKRHR